VSKVYNIEKRNRKKKLEESEEAEGPSSHKKRKSAAGTRYPPLDDSGICDEATYKQHLDTLEKELQKPKPNKKSILQLMHSTFVPRRQFVVEGKCSAKDILEKFPALQQPDVVSMLSVNLFLCKYNSITRTAIGSYRCRVFSHSTRLHFCSMYVHTLSINIASFS